MDNVKGIFSHGSESLHRRLEPEARTTKHNPGTSIRDYIMTHRIIRQKMDQESYPNINNEQTTVHFVVNDL